MRAITFLLITSLFGLTIFAQETTRKKISDFELTLGVVWSNTNKQMAKHMIEHDFDANTPGSCLFIFCIGPQQHPQYSNKPQISYQISYSHYLSPKSRLGLIFSRNPHNRVTGASAFEILHGRVRLSFQNNTITPFFNYDLTSYFNVRLGAVLLFNTTIDKNSHNNISNESKNFTPGVLIGGHLNIWNANNTYGKIGGQYIIASPINVGPFTATHFNGDTRVLPETKINFNHFIAGFTIGVHIVKGE